MCEQQAAWECTEVSSMISLYCAWELLLLTQEGRTQAEQWSCCTKKEKI